MKNVLAGLHDYLRAQRLLLRRGLWPAFLIPGIFSLLYFPLSIANTFAHAWRHRGRTIGHGLGFTLLLFLPVVGWFLAPSYGIVAGTLGVIDTLGENQP
ncbi:MAG: hypothetical protein O3A87_12775 [Verrucomicrobia bacterium]|nr:hypothetical protein [Verrucomicrobiota bacterium]MDA1007336.1 hypothetical protein [Verrucomicrobiota bacterium]